MGPGAFQAADVIGARVRALRGGMRESTDELFTVDCTSCHELLPIVGISRVNSGPVSQGRRDPAPPGCRAIALSCDGSVRGPATRAVVEIGPQEARMRQRRLVGGARGTATRRIGVMAAGVAFVVAIAADRDGRAGGDRREYGERPQGAAAASGQELPRTRVGPVCVAGRTLHAGPAQPRGDAVDDSPDDLRERVDRQGAPARLDYGRREATEHAGLWRHRIAVAIRIRPLPAARARRGRQRRGQSVAGARLCHARRLLSQSEGPAGEPPQRPRLLGADVAGDRPAPDRRELGDRVPQVRRCDILRERVEFRVDECGGYYASSYPTAHDIYCADDPAWKTLSKKYLVHFATLAQARARFPGRLLHRPC